jgi:hypothetical protein
MYQPIQKNRIIKSDSQSGVFNLRVALALLLCLGGVSLGVLTDISAIAQDVKPSVAARRPNPAEQGVIPPG